MKRCKTCGEGPVLTPLCPKCTQKLGDDGIVKQCPSCHQYFPDAAATECPNCLQPLDYEDAVRCSKCKEYWPADTGKCLTDNCGGKLSEVIASKCRTCGTLAAQSSAGCSCSKIALDSVPAKKCPKCMRRGVTPEANCPLCGSLEEVQGKTCVNCYKLFNTTAQRCDVCEQKFPFSFDKGCSNCNTVAADPMATVCAKCMQAPEPVKVCPKCKAFTFDMTATHCGECGKLKPEETGIAARSKLKRSREITTIIEVTARASVGHDVKGTKRGSPAKYCVQVWTESVRWENSERKPANVEFDRPVYLEARVKCTAVKKPRKQPPVPLSALLEDEVSEAESTVDETATEEVDTATAVLTAEDQEDETASGNKTEDLTAEQTEMAKLGPLRDLDKGHLVALFLGGVDNSWEIVPQVRDVNRGSWLAMESEIYDMAKDTAKLVASADLRVNGTNTLANRAIAMKIFIEYADLHGYLDVGDPRIPACFYVQIWLNSGVSDSHAIAHYLLLNSSRNVTPWPSNAEIAFFRMAHKALDLAIPDHDMLYHADARQENYDEYTDELPVIVEDQKRNYPLYKERPYGPLQWLHDFKVYVVTSRFQAAGYQGEVISLIRKYNRWKHCGPLRSDAASEYSSKEWNKGEKSDPFPELDEASGQAYPEVDHILPKKSGGLNDYLNARLVSFSLNHIYREKPSEPARTWDHDPQLKEKYTDEALRTSGIRVNTLYGSAMKERRDYLRNIGKRDEICENMRKLGGDFAKLQKLHREGVESFIANFPQDLKQRIIQFGFELPIGLFGPKTSGLRGISDVIKNVTD